MRVATLLANGSLSLLFVLPTSTLSGAFEHAGPTCTYSVLNVIAANKKMSNFFSISDIATTAVALFPLYMLALTSLDINYSLNISFTRELT